MNNHFAVAIQIAFLSAVASAQPVSVDPSSDIAAEIKRADAAWSAWRSSANHKLEQTILTNPKALADIARDEKGAVQYLDARRRLFEKMAGAFGVQIAALRASPSWNGAALEQVERGKLQALLAAEERILAAPARSGLDPVKQRLDREQQDRDLKDIAELKASVRRRVDGLATLDRKESDSRKQLDALTASLEQVRDHFRDLADSTDAEKAEWQAYFDGLRQIARPAAGEPKGKHQ